MIERYTNLTRAYSGHTLVSSEDAIDLRNLAYHHGARWLLLDIDGLKTNEGTFLKLKDELLIKIAKSLKPFVTACRKFRSRFFHDDKPTTKEIIELCKQAWQYYQSSLLPKEEKLLIQKKPDIMPPIKTKMPSRASFFPPEKKFQDTRLSQIVPQPFSYEAYFNAQINLKIVLT